MHTPYTCPPMRALALAPSPRTLSHPPLPLAASPHLPAGNIGARLGGAPPHTPCTPHTCPIMCTHTHTLPPQATSEPAWAAPPPTHTLHPLHLPPHSHPPPPHLPAGNIGASLGSAAVRLVQAGRLVVVTRTPANGVTEPSYGCSGCLGVLVKEGVVEALNLNAFRARIVLMLAAGHTPKIKPPALQKIYQQITYQKV